MSWLVLVGLGKINGLSSVGRSALGLPSALSRPRNRPPARARPSDQDQLAQTRPTRHFDCPSSFCSWPRQPPFNES